jgi:hypothetical protein
VPERFKSNHRKDKERARSKQQKTVLPGGRERQSTTGFGEWGNEVQPAVITEVIHELSIFDNMLMNERTCLHPALELQGVFAILDPLQVRIEEKQRFAVLDGNAHPTRSLSLLQMQATVNPSHVLNW